ncbi:MAG: hypothetical protein ACFFEY_08785 [Candidatus Thorarchaeota archaeon]
MLNKIDTKLKLKIMYVLMIIIGGIIGLLMLIIPDIMISILGAPAQDPYIYGVAGAFWLGMALLSILGLFDPLKYVPILLLQIIYKALWIFAVFIPNVIVDGAQFYTIFVLIVFIVFIVGDILAIPFKTVFKLKPE